VQNQKLDGLLLLSYLSCTNEHHITRLLASFTGSSPPAFASEAASKQ
jgi:hypothetical protein